MEEEERWTRLVEKIQEGQCTAFVGPGILRSSAYSKQKIAADWAEEFDYPLEEEPTLPQVAQYLAVTIDAMFPKDRIKKKFAAAKEHDFGGEDPYEFLANQPFRYYIDCYYDNFLYDALKKHPFRADGVKRDFARWDQRLQDEVSEFGIDFEPHENAGQTALFHMFGYADNPASLVVTQHDYLAFLENVSRDNSSKVIPPIIEYALTKTYLLFLGFNLFDLDLLILLQALDQRIKKNPNWGFRPHISVQFVNMPTGDETKEQSVEKYLRKYFGMLDISVCWGTCDSFIKKIRDLQRAVKNA